MTTLKQHWNSVYTKKEIEDLGWFESDVSKTMELIEATKIDKQARILNVGAGTTTLIDALIKNGFKSIIANDLSAVALDKLKQRINNTYKQDITCITDDLTQPQQLQHLDPVDIWIDRAVLHFFIDEEEQNTYFELVNTVVKHGGYVIIAVFALNGAETCSGLPLQRYDALMLSSKLGNNFKQIHTFNYTFVNPFGDERPYVYTLFQKQ